jgi:hypothetical protein
MNRRDFLKLSAAGAAASSLPFATRLYADEGDAPRFLFIVEGNGFEPASLLCDSARAAMDEIAGAPIGGARWWDRRYRNDAPVVLDTPDLGRSRYLQDTFGTAFPLEPLEEQGLVDQATVLLGLSSRIVGGGHSGFHGVLSSTRTIGGRPGGPTIDAHLAALPAVRGETPFDAFRVGVGGGTAIDFGTCAYGRARPAPLILDVSSAYEFAYGAFTEGDARLAFERRDRMLRFAATDLAAAERAFSGNRRELAKLGTYGDSIASLLESQDRLRGMDVVAPPAPATGLSPIPRFEALVDLATSTLIDGLAPVAVVGSGTGGAFGLTYSTISDVGRHDMQHGSGADPALLDAIRQINRAYVAAIARAAKRLADAGMLERTVIVWIGDNGEQHHSTASDFPVLLLGGTALGLRPGGRTVIYPGVGRPGHRQVSNLWNTLGYAAGQELDAFGGEEGDLRSAFGPLDELL